MGPKKEKNGTHAEHTRTTTGITTGTTTGTVGLRAGALTHLDNY
jgi:hypothetical protein